MLLSYNNYPYSAYACKNGIKHLIGNSKSIKFNMNKFLDSAFGVKSDYLKSFKSEKEALEFIDKTGIKTLIKSNFIKSWDKISDRRLVLQNEFDYKTKEYLRSNVYIENRVLDKERDAKKDEKAILIRFCIDSECLLCKKELSYSSSKNIVFDIENGFRSEAFCEDCLPRIYNGRTEFFNSIYIDKNKILIDILKEIE